MYPRIMPFCLLLRFHDGLKARYQVHFGKVESVKFELSEGTIVGKISAWEDGFPFVSFNIHSSLVHLSDPRQRAICERLIYNGMASAIQRMLLEGGMSNISFTHKLPSCVSMPDVILASPFVFLHSVSPGVL